MVRRERRVRVKWGIPKRLTRAVDELQKAAPAIRVAIRRKDRDCWGAYLELVALRFRSNVFQKSSFVLWPDAVEKLRRTVDPLVRYAARRDALECLQALHERECSFLPVKCALQGSLLHEAAKHGSLRTLCWLIEAQALSIHAHAIGNVTPLHLACKYGHVQIVRLLLEHKTFVDAPNVCGITPLHLALRGGHAEVAGLLLEAGANLAATSKSGQTPLSVAVEEALDSSVWTTVELLLDRGAALAHALPALLRSKVPSILRHPRIQSARLELCDQHEVGSLFETASPDEARALLERGARAQTAVRYALRNGDPDVLAAVRACHAFPYTDDDFYAALESVHGLDHLLSQGGDSNAIIESHRADERLPLIYVAARTEAIPVAAIMLLLEYGARPSAPADLSDMPLLIELVQRGRATPELIEKYVQCGHDVNVRGSDGKSALHVLVVQGWDDAIANSFRALLRAGAEIDALDRVGRTPLMDCLAAYSGVGLSGTAAILEAGASVKTIDKLGDSVLHHLFRGADKSNDPFGFDPDPDPDVDYLPALQLLVSRGADVSARDGKGRYPEEVSRARRNAELRESLRRLRGRLLLADAAVAQPRPLMAHCPVRRPKR
jgi:ankyrin repeat protein